MVGEAGGREGGWKGGWEGGREGEREGGRKEETDLDTRRQVLHTPWRRTINTHEPKPYFLHPTPHTLHLLECAEALRRVDSDTHVPKPYTLFHTPYNLHPALQTCLNARRPCGVSMLIPMRPPAMQGLKRCGLSLSSMPNNSRMTCVGRGYVRARIHEMVL